MIFNRATGLSQNIDVRLLHHWLYIYTCLKLVKILLEMRIMLCRILYYMMLVWMNDWGFVLHLEPKFDKPQSLACPCTLNWNRMSVHRTETIRWRDSGSFQEFRCKDKRFCFILTEWVQKSHWREQVENYLSRTV